MGCTSHPEVRYVSLIDPGLILLKNFFKKRSKSKGRFHSKKIFDKNNAMLFYLWKGRLLETKCPYSNNHLANIAIVPRQPLAVNIHSRNESWIWVLHSIVNRTKKSGLKEYDLGSVLMANNTQGSIKRNEKYLDSESIWF